jgi:hypothetical protein
MMMTLVRIGSAAANPAKDSRDWLDACTVPDLERASHSAAARAMPRVQVLLASTHWPFDIIGAAFASANEKRPSNADIFRCPNDTGV